MESETARRIRETIDELLDGIVAGRQELESPIYRSNPAGRACGEETIRRFDVTLEAANRAASLLLPADEYAALVL